MRFTDKIAHKEMYSTATTIKVLELNARKQPYYRSSLASCMRNHWFQWHVGTIEMYVNNGGMLRWPSFTIIMESNCFDTGQVQIPAA